MNPSRKLRRLVLLVAGALLAVALVAPAAQAANNIPSFWTSAQYESLVKFVDKLDELSGTPATAAKKTTYEGQLENKHQAALNKSTALFNRGKKAAQAESQRAYKQGVKTIRRTEAGELAALRRDYDARMNRAAANYANTQGRIEDQFDNKVATLRKQIKRMRNQKANATNLLEKERIQQGIERRSKRITLDREIEQEERSDLRAGYKKEKEAIRAGKASATRSVQQNDDEAIETLRNRNTRIYNTRVRTLQSQRTNQVGNLERKLNAGRNAISRMPVSG